MNNYVLKTMCAVMILTLLIGLPISFYLYNQQSNDSKYVYSDDYYLESGIVYFETDERVAVDLDFVSSTESRAKGLMFVESMPENEGMLFIFQEDSNNGFWMKNTLIPLDIIYIDSERNIVDIQKNAQPCKEDPCPTYPSSSEYRYVIEVNGGWCDANNIDLDTKITFPLLHVIY
jgi:uncharacterized membrane protein (UPF0127 family)